MAEWKFLTNHGRALLCIVHDPEIRLRDIAATLGITERSAYSIVNDLTEAGYVLKERDGRRNRYQIRHDLPLPDALIGTQAVGDVLRMLTGQELKLRSRPKPAAKPAARSGRTRA